MTSFRLTRRACLRGALRGVAVGVALPQLELMVPGSQTAWAAGTKRFGVWFWGNGVRNNRFTPTAAGAGAAWSLSEELAPFAAVKSHISIVSGMNVKTGNPRGHHAGQIGMMTGAPLIAQPPKGGPYASTFRKASIDQVAAAVLGKTTRFRSIELGISKRNVTSEGTGLRYLSHNGPDSPNPPEFDPAAFFNRLFGGGGAVAPGAPVADVTGILRKSVLDAVSQDIVALKKRVGRTDNQRLDQHAQTIREIENRLTMAPSIRSAGCAEPTPPATTAALTAEPRLEAVNKLMSDLLAVALVCDQTRVFSVTFGAGVNLERYPMFAGPDHHTLTHDEGNGQPGVHNITVFIMKQFAYMLERFKNTPDGGQSLLDTCSILGTSDVGEGLSHSITDMPIIVAGRAGGSLKGDVHFRGGGDNASKALLTVLRAAGVPLTEFGTDGGLVTSGVPAVEA